MFLAPKSFIFSYKLTLCVILCLNACFMSDHQSFVLTFQGQTYHGCINKDIVVLCSELLMRLSNYILSRSLVKSFWLTWGSNCGPSNSQPSTLPQTRQVYNFEILGKFTFLIYVSLNPRKHTKSCNTIFVSKTLTVLKCYVFIFNHQ